MQFDEFAKVALSTMGEQINVETNISDEQYYYTPEHIAKRCYDIASAMVEESNSR